MIGNEASAYDDQRARTSRPNWGIGNWWRQEVGSKRRPPLMAAWEQTGLTPSLLFLILFYLDSVLLQ